MLATLRSKNNSAQYDVDVTEATTADHRKIHKKKKKKGKNKEPTADKVEECVDGVQQDVDIVKQGTKNSKKKHGKSEDTEHKGNETESNVKMNLGPATGENEEHEDGRREKKKKKKRKERENYEKESPTTLVKETRNDSLGGKVETNESRNKKDSEVKKKKKSKNKHGDVDQTTSGDIKDSETNEIELFQEIVNHDDDQKTKPGGVKEDKTNKSVDKIQTSENLHDTLVTKGSEEITKSEIPVGAIGNEVAETTSSSKKENKKKRRSKQKSQQNTNLENGTSPTEGKPHKESLKRKEDAETTKKNISDRNDTGKNSSKTKKHRHKSGGHQDEKETSSAYNERNLKERSFENIATIESGENVAGDEHEQTKRRKSRRKSKNRHEKSGGKDKEEMAVSASQEKVAKPQSFQSAINLEAGSATGYNTTGDKHEETKRDRKSSQTRNTRHKNVDNVEDKDAISASYEKNIKKTKNAATIEADETTASKTKMHRDKSGGNEYEKKGILAIHGKSLKQSYKHATGSKTESDDLTEFKDHKKHTRKCSNAPSDKSNDNQYSNGKELERDSRKNINYVRKHRREHSDRIGDANDFDEFLKPSEQTSDGDLYNLVQEDDVPASENESDDDQDFGELLISNDNASSVVGLLGEIEQRQKIEIPPNASKPGILRKTIGEKQKEQMERRSSEGEKNSPPDFLKVPSMKEIMKDKKKQRKGAKEAKRLQKKSAAMKGEDSDQSNQSHTGKIEEDDYEQHLHFHNYLGKREPGTREHPTDGTDASRDTNEFKRLAAKFEVLSNKEEGDQSSSTMRSTTSDTTSYPFQESSSFANEQLRKELSQLRRRIYSLEHFENKPLVKPGSHFITRVGSMAPSWVNEIAKKARPVINPFTMNYQPLTQETAQQYPSLSKCGQCKICNKEITDFRDVINCKRCSKPIPQRQVNEMKIGQDEHNSKSNSPFDPRFYFHEPDIAYGKVADDQEKSKETNYGHGDLGIGEFMGPDGKMRQCLVCFDVHLLPVSESETFDDTNTSAEDSTNTLSELFQNRNQHENTVPTKQKPSENKFQLQGEPIHILREKRGCGGCGGNCACARNAAAKYRKLGSNVPNAGPSLTPKDIYSDDRTVVRSEQPAYNKHTVQRKNPISSLNDRTLANNKAMNHLQSGLRDQLYASYATANNSARNSSYYFVPQPQNVHFPTSTADSSRSSSDSESSSETDSDSIRNWLELLRNNKDNWHPDSPIANNVYKERRLRGFSDNTSPQPSSSRSRKPVYKPGSSSKRVPYNSSLKAKNNNANLQDSVGKLSTSLCRQRVMQAMHWILPATKNGKLAICKKCSKPVFSGELICSSENKVTMRYPKCRCSKSAVAYTVDIHEETSTLLDSLNKQVSKKASKKLHNEVPPASSKQIVHKTLSNMVDREFIKVAQNSDTTSGRMMVDIVLDLMTHGRAQT